MLGEETDSQAGLSDLDHRVLNAVDVNSAVHHDAGDQPGDDFVANEDRHDGAGVADDAVSFGFESSPQVLVVLSHLLPALDPFLIPEDVELGQRGSCLGGVDRGRVGVGVSHVAEKFENFGVFDAHEPDVGAETLTSGAAEQHVGEVSQSLLFPSA